MMMWGLKVTVLRRQVDIIIRETNGAFMSPETMWLFNRDGNNQPGVSVLYRPYTETFGLLLLKGLIYLHTDCHCEDF